jgi:hypothetical protein
MEWGLAALQIWRNLNGKRGIHPKGTWMEIIHATGPRDRDR